MRVICKDMIWQLCCLKITDNGECSWEKEKVEKNYLIHNIWEAEKGVRRQIHSGGPASMIHPDTPRNMFYYPLGVSQANQH